MNETNETTATTPIVSPIDRQPDDDVADENAARAAITTRLAEALNSPAPFADWLTTYHENLLTWDEESVGGATPQPGDIVGQPRDTLSCPLANYLAWVLTGDDLTTPLGVLTGAGMRFRDVWVETSSWITLKRYATALVGDDLATDTLWNYHTPEWAMRFICRVDESPCALALPPVGVSRALAQQWLMAVSADQPQ